MIGRLRARAGTGFFLAVAVLASVTAACRRQPSAAASFEGAPVILISVDTLRADHLPAYGYGPVATPHLDALGRDSILFENASTSAPLTLPAHVSMMTGLTPPRHGVRNNLGYRFDGNAHPTLARLLRARGYATGGAISAFVLNAGTGIADSMDFFDDHVGAPGEGAEAAGAVQRSGQETMRRALSWVRSVKGKPFFLFLHIYEPHFPYTPPEPFRSRYGATYDGEIAASDAIVGEFVDALKSEGIYDRAVVLFVSDHGEGLGDHGEQEHGILLHREVLRVPMTLKLPGASRAGTRVKRPVGLVDIVPTVAQILEVDPPQVEGVSLLQDGPNVGPRGIYSETYYPRVAFGWSELRSLTDDRYHWIDGPRPELYDIVEDPGERADLASIRVSVADAMKRGMAGYTTSFAAPESVDAAAVERLKALGYLGTAGATPNVSQSASLPNPRDKIHVYEDMRAAFRLAREGKYADAVVAFRRVLATNPGSFDAQWELGTILAKQGRHDLAAEAYKQAMRISPSLAGLVALSLGDLELSRGQTAEAERAAKVALATEPIQAQQLLARIALARGDLAEAERQANLAKADSAAAPRAAVLLAQVQIRRSNLPLALATLEGARAIIAEKQLPPVPGLEYHRADALARVGRYAEAEAAFKEEIRAFPTRPDAYASLAVLLASQGRPRDEVHGLLDAMVRASPRPETMALAAKTLQFMGDVEGANAWRKRAASS